MASIEQRIERLEGAIGNQDAPTVCVCLDYRDETSEQVVARYCSEHPDTPECAQVIVVNTGFYRSPDSFAGTPEHRP